MDAGHPRIIREVDVGSAFLSTFTPLLFVGKGLGEMNCPLSSRQVKKQSILDHACKNVWSFFCSVYAIICRI
ncbi:hypothetical protein ACTQ5X_10585, partial [Jeotgalibaca porci]|uniref:hypothetical protein n=1 Tax=Jeotgalibaca porci TaxID=1868793 RepID=UPI003F9230A9